MNTVKFHVGEEFPSEQPLIKVMNKFHHDSKSNSVKRRGDFHHYATQCEQTCTLYTPDLFASQTSFHTTVCNKYTKDDVWKGGKVRVTIEMSFVPTPARKQAV